MKYSVNTRLLSSLLWVLSLGFGLQLSAQQNIAPLATISDSGLNYVTTPGSPPFVSNQSYITDGNIETTLQMDYQVAFDNAMENGISHNLFFDLDQPYIIQKIVFYNSHTNNITGIDGTIVQFANSDASATPFSQQLLSSNEFGQSIIEINNVPSTLEVSSITFIFSKNFISFREIEIYGTPINPSGGNPGTGNIELWKKSTTSPTIYHEDGLVRIGNETDLPTFNSSTNSYISPKGLIVNGHTTFNVGRGDVFLENNSLDDATGAGLTLRTSLNPSLDAPIFSVRSLANIGKLWVGQKSSSFGSNDFYFGGSDISNHAYNKNEFKGILTADGKMGIGTVTPERALHIKGSEDGILRIDSNQNKSSVLFVNYNVDWSTISNSGLMALNDDGSFEIADLNGVIGSADKQTLLKINGTTHDVHITNSLSVGKDAEKISGAVAHFDGRVYISEEDGLIEEGGLESATEKGFSDQTVEMYKNYLFWVEKGIATKDFAIVDTEDWPDYVFDEDYKLTSIEKLKTFLKQNGHLPTMPSAKEIGKKGFTVSDMTKRMLQSIEEMTLHVVEHDNNLNQMQDEAEGRIKRLKALLELK